MNVPVEKVVEVFDTIMHAFPDPGLSLGFFGFEGAGIREVFVSKNAENRSLWPRDNTTRVLGKEGEVEMVEVFETETSISRFEMEEIPVDPVNFGFSISFPNEVG